MNLFVELKLSTENTNKQKANINHLWLWKNGDAALRQLDHNNVIKLSSINVNCTSPYNALYTTHYISSAKLNRLIQNQTLNALSQFWHFRISVLRALIPRKWSCNTILLYHHFDKLLFIVFSIHKLNKVNTAETYITLE